MKLFFVPALFLAGLFIFINPVHAEANWQNTFEYYNFDTYNDSTWLDSGSNNFNITGQTNLILDQGKFGNAQYYNRSQTYSIGENYPESENVIQKDGYISISFWYKLNEDLNQNPCKVGSCREVLYKTVWGQDYCTGNNDYLQVHLGDVDRNNTFKVQFMYDIGNQDNIFKYTSSNLTADQSWHNIVIVWKYSDPTSVTNGIWVDGVKDDQAHYENASGEPWNLANTNQSCDSYFGPYNIYDIAIDDLAIVKGGDITPNQIALLQTESYGDMLGEKPSPTVPTISRIGQFKSDGTTPLAEGGAISGNINFQGTPSSPVGNQVQLQVEVRPSTVAFTGGPTATSSFVASGQLASATASNLPAGQYHWQARAVDSQGNVSAWQTMSNPAIAADFTILREPVIIVPGILGSYLKDRILGDELWPNFALMSIPGPDSYLDALKLNKFGGQDDNNPLATSTDIFRSIGKLDFFSGLIKELENNGYEENQDLFVFPYDWRMNLDLTAGDSQYLWQETLKQKIIDIKKQTGTDKIDIIAHSMGGLLVKDYINKYGNANIDKFIDIATPQLGSPYAFKVLNYGDDLSMYYPGTNRTMINISEVKAISQNMPSIYQLLPSRKYFESDIFGLPVTSGYIYDIVNGDEKAGILSPLNYDQSINFLATVKDKDNSTRNQFLLGYFGINAINVNDELHGRLDNLPNSDNYYNIIGCGQPTYSGIEKKGDKNWELAPINGDGTVPLKSAVSFGSHQYYTNATTHSYIPSINGVRQLVVSILQGTENNFDFSSYSTLGQDQKIICRGIYGYQVGSLSSVELNIYDENGNHTGPTANGDVEENIPGVTYDILGSDKYAFLPAGHNYRVVNQAISTGELGITIQKIENNQPIKFVYFNSIKLNSALTSVDYNITDNQTQYEAEVDSNGDGIIDQVLDPDSILAGNQMNDLTAPQTAINISGQAGNNGYYVSNVQVQLSATDDNAGVLKTEYSLDGGNVWTKYNEAFTVSQDGTTTILYYSVDKAGNQEENKTATVKIDQTKPTISILLPQEGQEALHNETLNVEYFASDNFSNLDAATAKIYLDGNLVNSNLIDMFGQNLGSHQIKISIKDLAGNQAAQTVDFSLIADVDGTIADVNRAYTEKMITKIDVKNDLVNSLTDIKNFQEKYGQRIDKEKAMRDRAMTQCLKHKNQAWCETKIGKIFDRFEYQPSKINQALIKLKYNLILTKLDIFLRAKLINQAGYNIIKEDIKYLISKL